MVTLLIDIVRVKDLVLSVGAVSIYLLDWAYIQQPLKLMFKKVFTHILSYHDFKLGSNCFRAYYFVWKKKAP